MKNDVEIRGLRRAHRRDGACYVQFLAWMDEKMSKGSEITEWEAAWRLTEFRRKAKNYIGLAYETISASGPNGAFPHYHPLKKEGHIISKDTPYVNDSGGQYRDGTCDTTRTMHYGRPTSLQREAYTRVLQGHVGGFFFLILHAKACSFPVPVDRDRHSCFPKGYDRCPTGCPCAEEFMAGWSELSRELIHVFDLSHRDFSPLPSDRQHGTGHGVGSFLIVHEGFHSFSSDVPLVPGHVISNEPGYCKSNFLSVIFVALILYVKTIDKTGKFGIRIESVLLVRSVQTRHTDPDETWYGFERLTCVPIQTRMVEESMLSNEEKEWLREHNRQCLHSLEDLLQDDKRALNWLRREAERPIGVPPAGPGGVIVDWE